MRCMPVFSGAIVIKLMKYKIAFAVLAILPPLYSSNAAACMGNDVSAGVASVHSSYQLDVGHGNLSRPICQVTPTVVHPAICIQPDDERVRGVISQSGSASKAAAGHITVVQ